MPRFKFALFAAAAAILLGAAPARAQSQQPVRIVVGFAPGGILTTLTQRMTDKLRASLNSTVIVDNRPGAAQLIAIDFVKKAPPDGHAILFVTSSAFTIYPHTYTKLNYDPHTDFLPVARLVTFPLALSTGVNQPYKSFEEYRRWVRAEPGRGIVGTPGLGSSAHFAMLEMGKAMGVAISVTPYKGSVPLLADEMGGHIPAGMDSIGSKLEQHRAGKVRLLAVTGNERSPLAREVPSFAELGIRSLAEFPTGWYGAFVAANTPAEVVQKLSSAIGDALNDPATRGFLESQGITVAASTPAELKAVIESENRYWKPVISATGFVVTQ